MNDDCVNCRYFICLDCGEKGWDRLCLYNYKNKDGCPKLITHVLSCSNYKPKG